MNIYTYLWPGGLRGAIRRPCRRHGTACQTQSAKIRMPISICRSQTPLISPPSAPAHSARPTHQVHNRRSCDFAKTIASAEQEAKKLSSTGLVTNMHQKCKLQTASFMLFMFQLTFCITFFQKCCSCSSGDNIFAKRLQAILIKNFTFLTPKRSR